MNAERMARAYLAEHWRSLFLDAIAGRLEPGLRAVLDAAPPAHSGGRCTCDADGVYHVQVSRDLAPELAARVVLHELGHAACKHVGPVTALTANPPALLRAVWAHENTRTENEADCWAALRWAELSPVERRLLAALATWPEG